MKRISRRMILLIVLMAVLALGVGIVLINYFANADDWVVFSVRPMCTPAATCPPVP